MQRRVVNPEEFAKQRLRILFIGKETNDYKDDLRELMRNGPKHHYAHNVARWAMGILNGFPDFRDNNKYDKLTDAGKRIAMINLKKATGKASANMNAVSAYALNDKDLLLKQIIYINPNIIISLDLHDILIWLLDLHPNPNDPNGAPYYAENLRAWIIPWQHPSFRGSTETPYDKLRDFVYGNNELAEFINGKK